MKLKPLGIFAVGSFHERQEIFAQHMRSISGAISDAEERSRLVTYLRGANLILEWMEGTEDIVGGAFLVSGGSAIVSDGTYFWRFDTANYVETYGVALPPEFVDHVRSCVTPKALSKSEVLDLDRALLAYYRSGQDQALLTSD